VIPDEDIGCHIPFIPEAVFGEFNWFLSSVRFGRLLSKAQSTLFSVSATMKLQGEYQQDLHTIRHELEIWRLSVPSAFRPGERFARTSFANSTSVMAALRTHLVYHNFVMVLCRLSLQVGGPHPVSVRKTFMSSARRVIELIGHLEVEPYAPSVCVLLEDGIHLLTSNRLLTVIPLSAFLSLFHLVIDNPRHVETRDNLNFLDIAAGYFRRLEYVTKQDFPFSVFPKLASIVQEYVQTLPPLTQTALLVQAQISPSPDDNSIPEVGLDLHTSSSLGLSGSTVEPFQEQGDMGLGHPMYGMSGGSNSETLPFAVEGTTLGADVTRGVQENEVMDFFGYLLDGTSSSLYGNDFSWQ
jgi:hypothetical protein